MIATQGRARPGPPLVATQLATRAAASAAAVLVLLMLLAAPALARGAGGATLGGGSDLDAEQVVTLPAGGALPALHSLFVENPEDEAVEVNFTADAPEGIQVTGAWEQRTLAAGETARNAFAVEVSEGVAPGDHEVYVQIARADIESRPGELTGIPAVGARFTVRVVGEAAGVTVEAVSVTTGEPVDGTISLSAISDDGSTFEVQRAAGSRLEALVAPGRYRASFLLGDRIMAQQDVDVVVGDSTDIRLEVQTVAFTLTDARPVYDQGRLVVVELTAAVQNEIGEIADAVLQVSVHRGDEVEAFELQRFPVLPEGVSEAAATYRPEQGWRKGQHRFVFELVTPDFTLVATDQPELTVADTSPGWMPAALAATAALLLIGAVAGLLRRRRRGESPGPHRTPASTPPPPPPTASLPVPPPPRPAPPPPPGPPPPPRPAPPAVARHVPPPPVPVGPVAAGPAATFAARTPHRRFTRRRA